MGLSDSNLSHPSALLVFSQRSRFSCWPRCRPAPRGGPNTQVLRMSLRLRSQDSLAHETHGALEAPSHRARSCPKLTRSRGAWRNSRVAASTIQASGRFRSKSVDVAESTRSFSRRVDAIAFTRCGCTSTELAPLRPDHFQEHWPVPRFSENGTVDSVRGGYSLNPRFTLTRARGHKFSAEEKSHMVLEGVRAEVSVAELCQREAIHPTIYYKWLRDLHRF